MKKEQMFSGFLSILTGINVVVPLCFAVIGILDPASILPPYLPAEKGILIFALYAGARTVPLAFVAIYTLFKSIDSPRIAVAALAGGIQIFDGFIGIYQRDIFKSAGPLVLGIVTFFLIYLIKSCRDRC
jgi:hypothetical protein